MVRKKLFYGWIQALACFFILGVTLGLYNNCMIAFVEPVTRSLELSRSSFLLTVTIRSLVVIVSIPVFTKLYKRYSMKNIMVACAIICSGSIYLNSFCTEIWQFYILSVVYGFFTTGIGTLTVSALIGKWFQWKRATATGIAFAGSGIISSAVTPVVNNIINRASWQEGYRFIAVVGVSVLLVIIILFVKDSPEKTGMKPLMRQTTPQNNPQSNHSENTILNSRNTYQKETKAKSLVFLCGFTAIFFIALIVMGIQQHIMASLTDAGYSVTKISAVMSIYLGVLTFTKILWGFVYDRVSVYVSFLLIALSLLFSGITFGLAQNYELFAWVFAIVFSFGFAHGTVTMPHIVTCFFDDAFYVDFCGYITIAGTLGASLGPLLSSYVYDLTGKYTIAIWIYIVLSVLTLGILTLGWAQIKNSIIKQG